MKVDLFTKVILIIIAILLAGILVQNIDVTKTAYADKGEVGKYQVSAWAAQAGARTHHNGYYTIDTTTGKIVDSGAEIHSEEKIDKVIHKKEY
jgi:hypothetical protein